VGTDLASTAGSLRRRLVLLTATHVMGARPADRSGTGEHPPPKSPRPSLLGVPSTWPNRRVRLMGVALLDVFRLMAIVLVIYGVCRLF
jgi:hypothetical protein